jgi:hypothetical protein
MQASCHRGSLRHLVITAKRIVNQYADQVIELEAERKPVLSEVSDAMEMILEMA